MFKFIWDCFYLPYSEKSKHLLTKFEKAINFNIHVEVNPWEFLELKLIVKDWAMKKRKIRILKHKTVFQSYNQTLSWNKGNSTDLLCT